MFSLTTHAHRLQAWCRSLKHSLISQNDVILYQTGVLIPLPYSQLLISDHFWASHLHPQEHVCSPELQSRTKLLVWHMSFFIFWAKRISQPTPTHMHSSTHTALDPFLHAWFPAECGSSPLSPLDVTSLYLTFSLEVSKLRLIQASTHNLVLIWCGIFCLAFFWYFAWESINVYWLNVKIAYEKKKVLLKRNVCTHICMCTPLHMWGVWVYFCVHAHVCSL